VVPVECSSRVSQVKRLEFLGTEVGWFEVAMGGLDHDREFAEQYQAWLAQKIAA
jgi:hypothetical protein